jgi:uncharacterized membrane protein YoaK (UPF0700 family)
VLNYLRKLTGNERSERHDEHLAQFLTFIAGAANAGGYMAFRQYTSHMTGIASAAADSLAIGHIQAALSGLIAILCFIGGAALSAILINWGRLRNLKSQYAIPLLIEAGLLGCFGLFGEQLQSNQMFIVPLTVMLLCFVMGLQNAMITKLSGARIRTTHITGMVTDVGIEVGKLIYVNSNRTGYVPVRADIAKMRLLFILILLFFTGGVIGAVGFNRLGFSSALFLTAILTVLAITPVIEDVLAKRLAV